jgi:hypothetical protein
MVPDCVDAESEALSLTTLPYVTIWFCVSHKRKTCMKFETLMAMKMICLYSEL